MPSGSAFNTWQKFAPGYVLYSSGHLSHSLGIEAWISIDKTFELFDFYSGKVLECFVDHELVCFIYGDPRLLIVSFELFGAPIYVANVHALHQSHGVRVCIAFWQEVCVKIVEFVPNLSNLILLGDFNTKLGGAVSECIGNFAADSLNKVGRCVHDQLTKLKLAVPSAFRIVFLIFYTHIYPPYWFSS